MGNWEVNKPNLSEIPTDSDAISRHAAMETFNRWAEFKDYTHVERHILHAVVDEIRAMPSISEQFDEWTPILKDLYDGMAEMEEQKAELAAELATKTCNKQITSKLEDAELSRDYEETCNNKQVISKLVTSEDAISRQAAIDAIRKDVMGGLNYEGILTRLPSVTPKQRTGRWVESYINQIKGCDDIGHFYVCTECGRYINLRQGTKLSDYPYCHCGAKMVELQESEVSDADSN